MRVVFFGTGTFAVPALRAIAGDVILAVAQPARPSGRGKSVRPSAVEAEARELGIEVATPEKARAVEFVERIEALAPDALVVASYGQILSQRLLDAARIGGINLHGSILPRWRGAAPIQRAIEAGDPETGVTLMQMDRGMDTGDAIADVRTAIAPDETAAELSDRLALLGAGLLTEWWPRLAAGTYPRTPQPDEGVTLAPKLTKDEARLDLRDGAATIVRKANAFSPSPGAFLLTESGPAKLLRARLAEGTGRPGEILARRPLVVAAGEGALEIVEIAPPGGRRASGADWANGGRLRVGDALPVIIEP